MSSWGASAGRAANDWRIATAIRTAQIQYQDHELSIRGIAREMRTSPRYLGRLFRKYTGLSFHRYLLELRMKAAGKL